MNEKEKQALTAIQCATCARKPKHRATMCHWYTGEVCEEWLDMNDHDRYPSDEEDREVK